MGNTCKKSTLTVDNAKIETAVGSCGWGSCRSSCCEEHESELDAQHKQMETAIRVELALVHKMVTDEMIAALAGGKLPRLDVVRDEGRITIVVGDKK
jgi:hypothetical protein